MNSLFSFGGYFLNKSCFLLAYIFNWCSLQYEQEPSNSTGVAGILWCHELWVKQRRPAAQEKDVWACAELLPWMPYRRAELGVGSPAGRVSDVSQEDRGARQVDEDGHSVRAALGESRVKALRCRSVRLGL